MSSIIENELFKAIQAAGKELNEEYMWDVNGEGTEVLVEDDEFVVVMLKHLMPLLNGDALDTFKVIRKKQIQLEQKMLEKELEELNKL